MTKKISLGEGKSVHDFLFTIHTDTKVEEKEIIEGLLQRLQYINFECEEQERPDFSVKLEGLKIGVEITKYYSDFTSKGSQMQRKYMQWKNFAQELKKIFEEKHPKFTNIYSSIHFKEKDPNYKLLLKPDYLNEIIKSLEIFKNGDHNPATLKLNKSEFPHLFTIVDHFFFERKKDSDNFLWWNATLQSGNVLIDKNSLSNIIAKKENASKGYEDQYDQKWLLIYAAGIGLADIFPEFSNNLKRQGTIMLTELESRESELEPQTYSVRDSKYFDRILVWDRFHEKIFLLSPYFKKLVDYGEEKIWVNHLPHKILKMPKR